MGKYGKIAKLPREVQISYAFAYVFATFAASPAPIMEPPRGGGRRPPPLWRRPKAASIMGAGEAANIANTYMQANAYKLFVRWELGYFAIFPLCRSWSYSFIEMRGDPFAEHLSK